MEELIKIIKYIQIFTTADFLLSLLLGVFVIVLIYLAIQIGVQYIICKRQNFEKKYVKPFKLTENQVSEFCHYDCCTFQAGQLVVECKCGRKMHYDQHCWIENGRKCCVCDFKQHYFEKRHAFAKKNSPYFLKWALSGAIGGFIVAISYLLIIKYSNLFTFLPELCLSGILLGFVLTFIFTWINEYRSKKEIRVLIQIIFRSLIGATVGFLAFFITPAIFEATGNSDIIPFFEWLPWLLFAVGIALCLSIQSTIKKKDAIIGGVIAGVVGFLALFANIIVSPFGVVLSFILFGAMIGISVAVKHHVVKRRILKVNHHKLKQEITIYVGYWLYDSHCKVNIGKSADNCIGINWIDEEEKTKIHDHQAEIYIDANKKIILKALESGMSLNGHNCIKSQTYPLKHGDKFKIWNTEFQYVEE